MYDGIIDPPHYNRYTHQPREVSSEWFGHGSPAAFLGFDLSHVLGYLARLGQKDPAAYPADASELDRIAIDLGKARDYMNHALAYAERIQRPTAASRCSSDGGTTRTQRRLASR